MIWHQDAAIGDLIRRGDGEGRTTASSPIEEGSTLHTELDRPGFPVRQNLAELRHRRRRRRVILSRDAPCILITAEVGDWDAAFAEKKVLQNNKPLLIIRRDVEGQALSTTCGQRDPQDRQGLLVKPAGFRRPPQSDAAGRMAI
ncbi:hypothetical protein Q3W71_12550 [Micromonospora sp. C28SCA-DRY-2]|uniref:hypothetical protein n=1 Tax=Micromonospora sp. C28SCA-DRY-2 TaxID=3059522 RepID=UPI002674693E|nr:hypothetical protein [Micromonospora sp. C28SCA-DRY-2]MDO3702504.1 hypothetical protein [Micromonospora sp. C28SCA-DRY-2]